MGVHKLTLKKGDLTGKRFGRLTVVRRAHRSVSGMQYWTCRCACGVNSDKSHANLITGSTKSCGCSWNVPRYQGNGAARHNVLKHYQLSAKAKGLAFELSEEEFFSLSQQNCHYCNQVPSNTSRPHGTKVVDDQGRWFIYNGIDRVDNSKGYTLENSVACCIRCNLAKKDLTVGQFKDWIKKVYLHMVLGVSQKALSRKSTATMIAELITTQQRMWVMHDEIANGKHEKGPDLLKLNERRVGLMRAIDEQVGDGDLSAPQKSYGGKKKK